MSQSSENVPDCASQESVECSSRDEFCFKTEYGWLRSLIDGDPPGHYLGKGCTGDYEDICAESGYYWYLFHWWTCCQGDGCNK